MARQIMLIRHGEADYEALHRHEPVYRGMRYDFAPLSPCGGREVERLAEILESHRPSLMVSSPYTRTLHTAALLAVVLRCQLTVALELHDWLPVRDGSGFITSEVVHQKITEYDTWKKGGPLPVNRTWETDKEMCERVMAVVHQYAAEPSLVIVSHEAVIKAVTGADLVPVASCHLFLVEDG